MTSGYRRMKPSGPRREPRTDFSRPTPQEPSPAIMRAQNKEICNTIRYGGSDRHGALIVSEQRTALLAMSCMERDEPERERTRRPFGEMTTSGTPQRAIRLVRVTTYAQGPDISAYSFPAAASFWRCPACPERPSDQAEL